MPVLVSDAAIAEPDGVRLEAELFATYERLTAEGFFSAREINANLVHAHWAGAYVRDVEDGGHTHLLCRAAGNDARLEHMAKGLRGLGMLDMLSCLDDAVAWRADNPEVAEMLSPLDPPQTGLAVIDDRFADRDLERSYYGRLHTRVLLWKHLEIVREQDLETRIRAVCMANPLRETRRVACRAEALDAHLRDPMIVGLRRAGLGARPEVRVAAPRAGRVFDLGMGDQVSWTVRSSRGPLVGLDLMGNVFLLPSPMPDIGDEDELARYLKSAIGAAKRETIASAAQHATEAHPAAVVVEILRRAGAAGEIEWMCSTQGPIAPEISWEGASYLVDLEGQARHSLVFREDGVRLTRHADEKVIGELPGADLEEVIGRHRDILEGMAA